jgi:hypothetical protein
MTTVQRPPLSPAAENKERLTGVNPADHLQRMQFAEEDKQNLPFLLQVFSCNRIS